MCHYGVVGLAIFGWMFATVARMVRQLARWTRGTALEIFAWTMPATMIGYLAWSFVEFEFKEKPFWEFLSLYTALYLLVRYAREHGQPLPEIAGTVRIPWRRDGRHGPDEEETETAVESTDSI